MQWEKKGLIYQPSGQHHWDKKYGILPTPVHIPQKGIIRVYFASTDDNIFGRVSFIDVKDNDPSTIVYRHEMPVLDIGEPGTFDDCGVNISSIVDNGDGSSLLYYVGYQRTFRMPYMLFLGSATLDNDKHLAVRNSKAPLIDRTADSYISHAAPFVIKDGSLYKMWLWLGNEWTMVDNKPYISASIGYAESTDGINWTVLKKDCLVPDPDKEFSLGRPWVIKGSDGYRMFYSVRYLEKLYRIGYAESKDGKTWERKDHLAGIDVSETGWDSEMICYPAIVETASNTYLFYNGNRSGIDGFGYAELVK